MYLLYYHNNGHTKNEGNYRLRRQNCPQSGHGHPLLVHNAVGLELTFARLHAFNPLVTNVCIGDTPTVPKPSSTRSATTDSARFPELAALWTRHGIGDAQGNSWRVNYELSFGY